MTISQFKEKGEISYGLKNKIHSIRNFHYFNRKNDFTFFTLVNLFFSSAQ